MREACLWLLFAVTLILSVFLLSGCAETSRPVVAAPASQPSSQPATVTMSRADFNALAIKLVEHNRDKNLALAECDERARVATAQDKAAQAQVDRQALQIKLMAILGPIGTVIVTAATALLVHFVK